MGEIDDDANDPFKTPRIERKLRTYLEDISSALGMILFTTLLFGLFGLVALWRILYELQRG